MPERGRPPSLYVTPSLPLKLHTGGSVSEERAEPPRFIVTKLLEGAVPFRDCEELGGRPTQPYAFPAFPQEPLYAVRILMNCSWCVVDLEQPTNNRFKTCYLESGQCACGL